MTKRSFYFDQTDRMVIKDEVVGREGGKPPILIRLYRLDGRLLATYWKPA